MADQVEEPEVRESVREFVEAILAEEELEGGKFAADHLKVVVGDGEPALSLQRLAELKILAAAVSS